MYFVVPIDDVTGISETYFIILFQLNGIKTKIISIAGLLLRNHFQYFHPVPTL